MQIGMIGLGRMGANMVRRLANGWHDCVVYDIHEASIQTLACLKAADDEIVSAKITATTSISDLVSKLEQPRVIWLMVPAAVVDESLAALAPLLSSGDIVIDGGNSYYCDAIRRGAELKSRHIHYLDVGTSGGIAGFDRGYCLMIGGEKEIVQYLSPIFTTLSPGANAAHLTEGRTNNASTADQGYLHCGPQGAGHFVKMIHNGIEYGIMGAYAEGLNILRHANIGKNKFSNDAETAPLRNPEHYQYEFDLPEITELWRRGSVIGSWLLDLTASALLNDPQLENYSDRVSDSGEGRWTIMAAVDEAVPAPILSAALFERFNSRGAADFSDKILSAMRQGFGGHVEKPGQ